MLPSAAPEALSKINVATCLDLVFDISNSWNPVQAQSTEARYELDLINHEREELRLRLRILTHC